MSDEFGALVVQGGNIKYEVRVAEDTGRTPWRHRREIDLRVYDFGDIDPEIVVAEAQTFMADHGYTMHEYDISMKEPSSVHMFFVR